MERPHRKHRHEHQQQQQHQQPQRLSPQRLEGFCAHRGRRRRGSGGSHCGYCSCGAGTLRSLARIRASAHVAHAAMRHQADAPAEVLAAVPGTRNFGQNELKFWTALFRMYASLCTLVQIIYISRGLPRLIFSAPHFDFSLRVACSSFFLFFLAGAGVTAGARGVVSPVRCLQ